MPDRQSFLFQGQYMKVNSFRWHGYGHKDTLHKVVYSFNSFLILHLSLVKVSVVERLVGFSLAILMEECWVR